MHLITQEAKKGKSLATREESVAISPADADVWALSPVSVLRGAVPTTQNSPTVPKVSNTKCQNSMPKTSISKSTTSQKHPCTNDLLQNIAENTLVPGTKQYSLHLPSGAPLPLPGGLWDIPDPPPNKNNSSFTLGKKVISGASPPLPGGLRDSPDPPTDKTNSSVTLGEKVILEISDNGNKKQIVLSSILSYTSKCLDERIKVNELINILTNNYVKSELIDVSKLAKSLLNKEE